MIKEYLVIKQTANKGRGVFTKKSIKKGTRIEISPVIPMSAANRALIDKTRLHDYIFEWREDIDIDVTDGCCMALGYVSVYNHRTPSNCEYFMDFEKECVEVKTVRDIKRGEELTINYNGSWDSEDKVWFEVKE